MSKPQLTVFAGCNGSGKSSFSQSLVPDTIIPFDFDKEKLKKLEAFKFDFELKEEMAYQETLNKFEELAQKALSEKIDFAYETNFNHNPLKWPEKFRNAGFEINLIYFALSGIAKAQERVAIRVQNGGHYVSNSEIQRRFEQGYTNLDLYFGEFNRVKVFDTTIDGKLPKHLFLIEEGQVYNYTSLPDYLSVLVPKLSKKVCESGE